MRRLLIGAILALCGITPAQAGFVSGNELYSWCSGVNIAQCAGYVEGAADAMTDDDLVFQRPIHSARNSSPTTDRRCDAVIADVSAVSDGHW
jgi:hypothetical protein